jgi:HEPN domain-containing protein
MKNITRKWIEKAEKDFLVAQREVKEAQPVFDAVCFHCQQCVEKYLKALLQEKEIYFEKTHDIGVLMDKCKDFIIISDEMQKKLFYLSSYAVEVRYPGIDTNEEEAKESFDTARKLRLIVRGFFELEVVG